MTHSPFPRRTSEPFRPSDSHPQPDAAPSGFNGGGQDDPWADYEAVNDPASGKKLPNEGHAHPAPIFVTDGFVHDVAEIYGRFTPQDNEYPSMGITIQGAAIFVECLRFPAEAVIRHPASDQVLRDRPDVAARWRGKLIEHEGRCRSSTVHIHPMNQPHLSAVDIANFDALRRNPDDPSTFGTHASYPVILVNLLETGRFELLGFWVDEAGARQTEVRQISDEADLVRKAWRRAVPMPYFSNEGALVRRVNGLCGKAWRVELGVHAASGEMALRARRTDGRCLLLRFDATRAPFGIASDPDHTPIPLEHYVDWTRLFEDHATDPDPALSNPSTVETAA